MWGKLGHPNVRPYTHQFSDSINEDPIKKKKGSIVIESESMRVNLKVLDACRIGKIQKSISDNSIFELRDRNNPQKTFWSGLG